MKNRALVFIFAWLLAGFLFGASEPSMPGWNYYKTFQVPTAGEFYQLKLDEEVYRNADHYLWGLRILDISGNQIPYILQGNTRAQEKVRKGYNTRIINRWEDKNFTYLELQILGGAKKIRINYLDFEKNGDFSLPLEIYGRYGDSDWTFITKDTIYAFEEESKKRVYFSSLEYPFYRLRVSKPYQISLQKVAAGYEETFYYLKEWEKEKELDFEEKENTVTIKNPDRLDLLGLKLEVDGNYRRTYNLFMVRDKEHKNLLVRGEVFHFQYKDLLLTQNKISLRESRFESTNQRRFQTLQLEWENKGNSPLKIKSIKGIYVLKRLVFQAPLAGKYTLFYDKEKSTYVEYDLNSFRNVLEYMKLEELSLSGQVSKKSGIREPQEKLNAEHIFQYVLITLSIVLIVFLYFKLRKSAKGERI